MRKLRGVLSYYKSKRAFVGCVGLMIRVLAAAAKNRRGLARGGSCRVVVYFYVRVIGPAITQQPREEARAREIATLRIGVGAVVA